MRPASFATVIIDGFSSIEGLLLIRYFVARDEPVVLGKVDSDMTLHKLYVKDSPSTAN
jgi:hypothetical protein